MKSQSNHYRSSFSTCLNSTRRLALIAPLVFGIAAVLGYTVTAKAPPLLKKFIGSRPVQAPLTEPVPAHRVGY